MAKVGKYLLLAFVAGTIIAGCLNSILTKYQDMQCVRHCGKPGKEEHFEEPVLQTLQMFVGEMLCWIPVFVGYLTRSRSVADLHETQPLLNSEPPRRKKLASFKDSLILAIPSTCDLLATTMLNVGLLYTPVSIYQMTRGAIILFVGLFSVTFLKRRISRIEWLSLFIVVFGVFVVGLSGSTGSKGDTEAQEISTGDIVFGMFIIVVGIMFSATQFVVEEYILERLEVNPLDLVGYEGFYGASLIFLFMVVAYFAVGRSPQGKEGNFDMIYSFKLMFNHSTVLISSILIMLSISSFNFFGISLTEQLSATARSTIDTSRTCLVWIVSLIIGWESFKFLQLLGFVMLAFGTLIFNGVIRIDECGLLPSWFKADLKTRDELVINVIDDIDEPIERF